MRSQLKLRSDLFFIFNETKDGSPSCRSSVDPEQESETMHSREGAFTETEYIYGEAARWVFQERLNQYRFLNIGLGLGYNELSIVCNAISLGIDPLKVHIESYELYPELVEGFLSFYDENKMSPNLFEEEHHKILEIYSDYFNIKSMEIKTYIQILIDQNQINIHGKIDFSSRFHSKFDAVLFDAYSAKSSPELWSLAMLDSIVQSCNPMAVFATYAATGDLKRALKSVGFNVPKRNGFAYKRESTFATKGR
ncbi:MAG: MnmC family methyltransferase [Bdellovibrionales bacterium]